MATITSSSWFESLLGRFMISKTTAGWFNASKGNAWSISALWTLWLYSSRRITWPLLIANAGSHTMYPGCKSWALIGCRKKLSPLRSRIFPLCFRDIESAASVWWRWFRVATHLQLYVVVASALSQSAVIISRLICLVNQIMSPNSFLTLVLPRLAECRVVRSSLAFFLFSVWSVTSWLVMVLH